MLVAPRRFVRYRSAERCSWLPSCPKTCSAPTSYSVAKSGLRFGLPIEMTPPTARGSTGGTYIALSCGTWNVEPTDARTAVRDVGVHTTPARGSMRDPKVLKSLAYAATVKCRK